LITAASVNVTDLVIFRRTQTGIGGAGTDAKLAEGLRAHVDEGASGSQDVAGRDVTITNTIMIDGFDNVGDLIKVKAHDLVQWTDWKGEKTKKLAIARVTPFSGPGRGRGLAGIAHVRLDIGN